MRDPKRIKRTTELLQALWFSNPDMRFFQLVQYLASEYSKENGGFGSKTVMENLGPGFNVPKTEIDLFYLEDNQFLEWLERRVYSGWQSSTIIQEP